MKISFFFSLIILIFASCSKTDYKWLSFKNENYQITYPDFLKSDSNINPLASMSYINAEKEFYCLVLDENKDTLANYGYEDMTLDDYVLIVKENHEILNLPYKILNETSQKVGNLNGFLIETEVDLSSTNNGKTTFTRGLQMVLEGKKGFYQVYVWCMAVDFEKNKPIMTQIINSFKEL
jgi:hypothetical protein